MSRCECRVPDCDAHDALRDTCKIPHMTAPCTYGRFYSMCERVIRPFADYTIKQYADYITATIKGPAGRAVIYGGSTHANEIWFFAKGDREGVCLTEEYCTTRKGYEYALDWRERHPNTRCTPTYLPDDVAKAMRLMGLSERLPTQ